MLKECVVGHKVVIALSFQGTTPNEENMEKQVEEESVKACLGREDSFCRSKWCAGVNQINAGLR